MRNRWYDAQAIQAGACNPNAIANSLIDAMKSAIAEGVNPAEDSACLMIAHQLAYIMGELYKDENTDCAAACGAEEALDLATLLLEALRLAIRRGVKREQDEASVAICAVLCDKLRIRQVDVDYFEHIDRVGKEIADVFPEA